MDYHRGNERIPLYSLSRVYHYALKLGISCTAQMSLGWLWQVQVPSNISILRSAELRTHSESMFLILLGAVSSLTLA